MGIARWCFAEGTAAPTVMMRGMKIYLPDWLHPWFVEVAIVLQVLLILLVAWTVRGLLRRFVSRLVKRYDLPLEVNMAVRRVSGFLVWFATLLAILHVIGVSAGVLWGAFTGFATVAAVAFFAAWSVLTNVFCAFLIMTSRPFRLHDHVELLESGERPGLRGQVMDITLIYVTLRETHAHGGHSLLRVPNSMFFQRAVRRWEPGAPDVVLQAAEPANGRDQRRVAVVGGGAGSTADPD